MGNSGAAASRSEAIAEAIAAKDLNNLYLTSCYFRDREKYRAFCSLYALMRVVDDRIDELLPRGELSPAERTFEHSVADAWERVFYAMVEGADVPREWIDRCGRSDAVDLLRAAADAMHRFPVPRSLWNNFFLAMHRDIDQVPLATFGDFLDYSEGASVAPTSIYLFLIAAQRANGGGRYRLPEGFDLIGCGRHLGTFAYLSHILRDLARDLKTGQRGLLYLVREDLDRFGLTLEDLYEDLLRKEARPALRELACDLVSRARGYLQRGLKLLPPLDNRLTPDCDFILQLIVKIYDRAMDKLAAVSFDPMQGNHQLTLADKHGIAREIARPLGFSLVPAVAKRWARIAR